jgi:multiple sugar transport system substrate-binding protein
MAKENLAPKYYGQIKSEFEAAHPGVTVKLIPIPGAPNDINSKIGLLYRSPSTAPTVVEVESADCGKFAAAGYLLGLNEDLNSSSWWADVPSAVKNECASKGTVYGVDHGLVVQALSYNKVDFKKAGLPVPWHPQSWKEIVEAALTIKHKVPGVTPIWAMGGTGAGTGIVLGVGTMLAGMDEPTVFNESTNKWIVESAGLKQIFEFLHELSANNLNAPVSDLFNANAPGNAAGYIKSPGAAIGIASSYWGPSWIENAAPEWKEAATLIGITPLPNATGGGSNVASEILGQDFGVYSGAPNKTLAYELVAFMMQKKQLIQADQYGEWVPPITAYKTAPEYVNFGKPFPAEFAAVLPHASELPNNQDLPTYLQGFEEATGELIQNPQASVASASKTMKEYVTEQLGESKVESK